ncbi:MAG TPA: hypothetical protein VNO30_06100 [Kofleriaceae bacterium]|nr:hypothetical protein [Kofleriaceae bacterium]
MGLTRESLWNKSKVFLERALSRRDAGEFEEFQLWAVMTLEVLGKAALAHVHPALVADPQDFESLLAACGAGKSPEFRTIQAKTVFSRCKRLVKGFDETCERFCLQMANDRNAELHSGAVPFTSVALDTWQPKLWHCVQLLTEAQGETLETLLGSDEAENAASIIDDASQALAAAVRGRIERARSEFSVGRSVEERKHVAAAAKIAVQAQVGDSSTDVTCPACQCVGILSGDQIDEEFIDRDEDEPWLRWVKQTYAAERFRCVACKLHLEGEQELEVAEISTEFEKEKLQEAYDDDDYGND